MNSNVYVVRSSHMQPFFETLKKFDTDLDPLLSEVGLSLSMFDNPETLIPEPPLWEFVELAAKQLNLPHFGFIVTENVCLDKYGAFGEYLCSAKSLQCALNLFINDLNTHTNFPNYWLEYDENYVWLCRKGTPGIEKGKWPVEQHVISFFIELVKMYAGTHWHPSTVKFNSDDINGLEYVKSFQTCNVIKGQPFGAIAIENSLLMNRSILNNKQNNCNSAVLLEEVPKDLVEILQHLFEQGLLQQGYFGKTLSVESIANKLGVNLRSLQRRIKEQDTSLKELVEQARYKSAKVLLKRDISTDDIAHQLGYSDVSNFIRSFKRWSGTTPRRYRALNDDQL